MEKKYVEGKVRSADGNAIISLFPTSEGWEITWTLL
jgi:hypothetical protein